MELICANKDTHEEFISKTHKQLMHLDIKETTQSNGAQDLNGPFPTENVEMAMKHMRRCSASVSIRIRSTMGHHLTQARKAIIENLRQ